MNEGRTIFSQLLEHAPHHHFRRCVERYRGNLGIRSFRCWDQFLCMVFAQLTYRESLRDIEACLGAVPDRLYHMGIRSAVSRSTLADANEKRNWSRCRRSQHATSCASSTYSRTLVSQQGKPPLTLREKKSFCWTCIGG